MPAPGYCFTDTIARSEDKLIRRARREQDGQQVIVKQLARAYPSLLSRRNLEFEYRILSKLEHPGIVRALAHIDEPQCQALILEDFGANNVVPIPGKGMPIADFLHFALQVVSALGAVHAQGVIHKGLKPHNLVMNQETRVVKMIDFQLATELSRERQELAVTNQLEGSLPYLSPEQTGRMNRDLDYRTDYYSLGVTFFQVLTGTLPFMATDVMGWIHSHISKAPPLCHDINELVPPSLSQIIAKLMAKEPSERYQCNRAILDHLEQCRDSWQAGGKIPELSLCRPDIPEKFEVPQLLVGRKAEIKTLLNTYKRACLGKAQVLLVAGYSGVGKSSLVRELLRPVVSAKGSFVTGKFDQLKRDTPYGALIEVMRELTKRLLTEPDQILQDWRHKILTALGENISLVSSLVPELTDIVGNHPEAPAANFAEAKNRFERVVAQFLGVFAHADRPVVIFLDDLQWCDASTPDLLAEMLISHDLKHLLIVCAYRDNEVPEGHLFTVAMQRVRHQQLDSITDLSVKPLTEESIRSLVSYSLHQPTEHCRELADLVFTKSSGNPFYAAEILANLYRTGAIVHHETAGGWHCDLAQARSAPLGANVVELMLFRVQALSCAARSILSTAACMGSQFEANILARLHNSSLATTLQALGESASIGLIAPLGDDYRLLEFEPEKSKLDAASKGDNTPSQPLDTQFRFQHDRIQQAAHDLLQPEERLRIHLSLGRLYLTELNGEQLEKRLFEIVNHLNLGRTSISDPREKQSLLELNFRAGERARGSTAFRIAANYLQIALELSPDSENKDQAQARFALERNYAECLLMAGDATAALQLCRQLLGRAANPLEQASIQLLLIRVHESLAHFAEAVQAVRTGLALLDVQLPEQQQQIDQGIGAGIEAMQKHLGATEVEDLLELPELSDPAHIMILKLLFQGIPSTIQTNPSLFILSELIMFELTVQHGLIPASAKNFVDCGLIQGGILGDYATAYRFGQVAFAVLDRFNARAVASSVNFVFATYVSSWRAPCEEAMLAFQESYRSGIESGDIQHTGYSVALKMHRLLHIGHELPDTRNQLKEGIRFLDKHDLSSPRTAVVLVEQALRRLCDTHLTAEELHQDEEEAKARVVETQIPQWIYAFGESQMMVSILLGNYASAEQWRDLALPQVPAAMGLISVPEFHLCETLIATRHRWPQASCEERERILVLARETRDKLKTWAEHCPENFSHKYHLVSAELARIESAELSTILEHYQQAAEATGSHYMHMRALACELQARFWEEMGNAPFSELLLNQAASLYGQWGAKTKVAQLAKQLAPRPTMRPTMRPTLLPTIVSSGQTLNTTWTTRLRGGRGELDLDSVLKANQAISSEVHSDRLYESLMATLLENAAAQHGSLLSVNPDTGELRLELQSFASAESKLKKAPSKSSPGSPANTLNSPPWESAPHLCVEVVRYALRTKSPLLIDNAATHELLSCDTYVQEQSVKSILCLPLLSQGKVVALLYAENNATTHAFAPERVETLRLIAGQAAISIVNARLYDELEARVEVRTAELATKNREVVAMLDELEQGILFVDEDLRIQPQYSHHLPHLLRTDDVVGQEALPLIFDDSDVSADARATMAIALHCSFGQSKTMIDINLGHLVRQFSRTNAAGETAHFEVDWKPIFNGNDDLEKCLVVLRDVTLLLQSRAEQARAARETEIVSSILAAGVSEFRGFCKSTRALLPITPLLPTRLKPSTQSETQLLFRDLHTTKGNARMLHLTELVDELHGAESLLDRAPTDLQEISWQQLHIHIVQVNSLLDEYEALGRNRLGDLWTGASRRLESAIAEIEAALNAGETSLQRSDPTLTSIRKSLRAANAIPLASLFRETARAAPSLAGEVGKSDPELDLQDGGLLLTSAWAQVLKNVLTHSLRNALDHGIEPAEERRFRGKNERGRLTMVAAQFESGLQLTVSDDGRGLALEKLRTNQTDTDQALAERLFDAGVTTTTDISLMSGRGVGLFAVRSLVQEQGGEVHLVFTGEEQKGHRPFQLVIDLPPNAYILP